MTRDAAAVGAGLAPARAARPIRAGERIHVVGVAGAGASAAARVAHWAGAMVSGCDAGGPSPYSTALEADGIPLAWSHAAGHVTAAPMPDRLAVSKALTAIDPGHPELEAARAAGIPLEPWQQVIADAASGRTLVAVAGTHGKSTTAGWLVHVLVTAGRDPSAFVGALLDPTLTDGLPATSRRGMGAAFVVEADEYAGNFDAYRPDVAVLTGAEWDHPDVFADAADVIDHFVAWLGHAAIGAVVVVNVADAGGDAIAERLADSDVRIVATALVDATSADLPAAARALAARHATRVGSADAVVGRIVDQDRDGVTIELAGAAGAWTTHLQTAGRHNVANALGVIGASAVLGLGPQEIATGLATFTGVGRRLERKGEADGVVVYDDYGHHPTAVRATIEAVRQREPGRRVWAVLEPLTYHRTAALLPAFADALATADAVAVADIWAGRDPDTTVASAAGLAAAVAKVRPGLVVTAPGSVEATADRLAADVRAGDVVLVMGGGHSYRIATGLLERLARRQGTRT